MANTVFRSLHDLGLAAWLGGTLANAVALNRAAGATVDSTDAGAVTNEGWTRWTPVNAAAIGAHLLGSAGQLVGNKDRVVGQKGVGTTSLVKTALTAMAMAMTGYSRLLGRKVAARSDVPIADGTTPSAGTPGEVAGAQKQLALLQWAVPALTGALIVVSAFAGEQQRPANLLSGLVRRVAG